MTESNPVGLTAGEQEHIKAGLHGWLDERRQTAYRRGRDHQHGPGCHEPDEDGPGSCDSYAVGMLDGIGWPGDLEQVVAEVVAPMLAAERAAHEALREAVEKPLREMARRHRTTWQRRCEECKMQVPEIGCPSLHFAQKGLAALAAAAPSPPQAEL